MRFALREALLLLVCLLLVSLCIAGCGGASASSTHDMTLKVAQVANNMPSFPLYVAVQEGFFKAQGLTLSPQMPPALNTGGRLSTAVETNNVEVGVGGATDTFTISRVDSSIRMIANVSDGFQIDVIVNKSFLQKTGLSDASPLADKVNALKGKKVGVSAPNSTTDALITYLFRQQGLNAQTDVTKENLGTSVPSVLAALQSGRVDAVALAMPGGEQAVAKGYGDILISPVRGDDPALMGQLYDVAYARQSVINAKSKAIQAFIRGLAQADMFMQQHADQTLTLLKTYLKTLDPKALDRAWSLLKPDMPKTPQICQNGYNVANQFHLRAGLITAPLAYNNLVAEGTINQALGTSSSC